MERNQNAQSDGNKAQLFRCYMNEHNVCSVTTEPSQSSSRGASS